QFRSVTLEGLRKQCEELQAKSKVLAEAVRARHFHAELPGQKPVNLADDARQLIASIALLSAALTKAEGQADQHEKLQIAWARPEVDAARTNLNLANRSLGQRPSGEPIHIVESAGDALVSTCAALALQPPQRALSRMVYDPVNPQIVLFGGDQLDRLLADTWIFDCASRRWHQKQPAVG